MTEIEMDPMSRSEQRAECLEHEGTRQVQERYSEILQDRQVKSEEDINTNTITVNAGPQIKGDISSREGKLFIINQLDLQS